MSTKRFGIAAGLVMTLMVVVSPAFAACSLTTMSECDNNGLMTLIAQLLGGSQTQTTTTTGTSISGIPAGFTFTTNLKQGTTGNDVKYLQVLLNSDAATSIGNAGKETTYFGAMTKAAVVKFQNKYASEVLTPYGLSTGTGFFGTSTRAKANALIAGGVTGTVTTYPAGCTSSTGFSSTTGQSCSGAVTTLPAGCTSSTGYSSTTGQPCSTGSVAVVSGSFAVGLATNNPASSTFVQGQSTANLANYTFSNGTSSDIIVTSVTVDRIGISADATLANVYLFDGAVRLTDAASVSAGKVTFNTVGGIFTIPANSTKTISVKSDLSASSNGQTVGVALSAVVSNGTLSSTLPVTANLHNIASATLATVAISNILPTGESLATDPISGVRVFEGTFTVGNRNVQFTKLALKQINSIDKADISNFQLLIDGTVVSTVASLDANNYVTFTFDKTLTTGSRNVKVLADVNGGSSRYIQMSLRNKADIDVKDADYGVNVSVTGIGSASAVRVNDGVFTITAKNSVLPVTISNNTSGALIGKWTFKASGEAVKVETLKAGFVYTNNFVSTSTSTTEANNTSQATCNKATYTASVDSSASTCTGALSATLRNGRIMINGTQAGSTATLAQYAANGGTEYTVNYTFQPGTETTVELYADIYDNDGVGSGIVSRDTVTAKLVYVAGNATKQVSLGVMAVPTEAQVGSTVASAMTVSSGSATLTATPNYGTQNTVLPQTAFKVGSWTMTAETAEDINVNGFSFAVAGVDGTDEGTGTSFTVSNMSDMYVTYQVGSGSAITTSVVPTPGNPATFSPSFTLPKGQTATINLYASLNGTVSTDDGAQATLAVTGTGAQSGASASFNGAGTGQLIKVAQASLTISKAASTPVSTLVTGSNTIKTVSYKFEALNDSYTISQLTFSVGGTSAVSSVNLKDGSTILASAPAAGSVVFNLATPISIAANTYKTLDVETVLGNIGSGMGASASNIATDLTGALVRPASSGTASNWTDSTNGNPLVLATSGNAIYVYKAIPTITLSTLPSGNLASGTNTIAKFTVGSDTGTIAWKKITFKVSKSDAVAESVLGGISNVQLWNGSTQVQGTALVSGLSANGSVDGTITFIPTTEEQVAGSITYTLKANVGGTIAIGDSINTRIDTGSTVFAGSKTAFAYKAAGADTYFDADATSTVSANDIRKTAVDSYTVPAGALTVAGTGTPVVALSKFGAASALTSGIVFTSNGTTWVNGDYSIGGTLVAPVFTKNETGEVITVTGITTAPDTTVLTVTFTKTVGGYAADSVVATGDSDLGLTLTGDVSTAVANSATFVWSDISQPSHSVTTADWTGDFLVKNIPTDTQNLTK